jgi:epidermal growth factor receptor kinase substrate 8
VLRWAVAGKMSPEEGIQKLRQMDETTGIWTMRVDMVIEPKNLVVLEKTNQVCFLRLC